MREKKKLGNKGFSLVELIVVIAIMAVLIAVLAPTLISKIEESREGTDLQAIGEINNAVKNALVKEDVYEEVVPTTGYAIYQMDEECAVTHVSGGPVGPDEKVSTGKLTEELQDILEKIEWKSKAASDDDAETYIIISSKGKVYTKRALESNGDAIEIQDGDDKLEAGTNPSDKTD